MVKEKPVVWYQKLVQSKQPKRPVVKNCGIAFVVGGSVCVFGQFLQGFFIKNFAFTQQTAGNPTVAVLIIIAVLLTGLGVYDKLAQIAGAGLSVPVTGFANSVASAAIEHKTEGYVLGVGGNMFKLAGSVLAFGIFAAFVVAIIRYVMVLIM